MTNDELERREQAENELFEIWFRVAMYIGDRCFVDTTTKRRLFRAWMARANLEKSDENA